MNPLCVIVARERASERESLMSCFAGCEVIVDRRVADRRRSPNGDHASERRSGDRRSGDLETRDSAIMFVH